MAFLVDSLTRPRFEDSLTYCLLLGRRSDRVINLFGEYGEEGHYTVDRTLDGVEEAVYSRRRDDIGGQWPALLMARPAVPASHKSGVMFLHDLIEQRLLRPVPDVHWPGRLPASLVSGHSGILA